MIIPFNDFDSRGIARQYFRYLPFTATELKEISQTFGNSGVYSAVRENASEKRLREMCAKSPDVLHLATHGFFSYHRKRMRCACLS